MQRLALLSFHGCPVARLGEGDTGGMNVYVLQVARELARRGCKVDVYTRSHDPKDPQIVDLGDGARVVHLKAGDYSEGKASLYDHIPEFLGNLFKFQQSEGIRYDLVHSHYWMSGRVGAYLRERWNVPHVITFHTLAKTKLRARAGERESELRVAVEQRLMDDSDAIVVSTEHEKQDILGLYGSSPQRIQVIPAGVDLDLFEPVERPAARRSLGLNGQRTILYVGRVQPLKGLDILLNAVAMLEDRADVRLLIVGGRPGEDSEMERLKTLSGELGISEIVTFTGAVAQAQLPDYYSAADVFVLPSHYESFGLAALEAMACGTPVVASRVGGLTSVVDDGKTGYLIPWRCPEPFAQRLDMLLANPRLREAMGGAARAKAMGMSWHGVVDELLDFYCDLMGEGLRSAAGA